METNHIHTYDKSKRRRASMACVLRFPFLNWKMNSYVKLQNFPIFQYKQHKKSIKYQQIVGTIPNLLLFITFRIVVDFFVPHKMKTVYNQIVLKSVSVNVARRRIEFWRRGLNPLVLMYNTIFTSLFIIFIQIASQMPYFVIQFLYCLFVRLSFCI